VIGLFRSLPRALSRLRRLPPLWLALATSLIAAGGPVLAQTPPAPSAAEVARSLGRGLNILGYDPIWITPAWARFKAKHFAAIHDAGFSSVRVNLVAFDHMDGDNRLNAQWLSTLDWVVSNALANHLAVILDEHDYNICSQDPVACRPRLLAFWSQIAERYKDAPSSVLFEILNEPNTKLTDDLWGPLSADALAVIRRSNPTRTVIIGPTFWNNIDHLDTLQLPAGDRNILVTVHYYLPMRFTHQGASWSADTRDLSGITWGSPAEYARLNADFDRVKAWSLAHDRPILLGEFGAYDKADMDSRVRYTSAVARAAEARGWPWEYWQFDSNFIAYDMSRDTWVEPIRGALAP